MTVVVGVSTLMDAFVVADCRLTFPQGAKTVVRDYCQKLVIANGWSVVGLAGDLCLARYLAEGFTARLRETPQHDPNWLKDHEELRQFVVQGIRHHDNRRPEHEACKSRPAEILIAWMDFSRQTPSGEWTSGPPAPEFRLTFVKWNYPELQIGQKSRGTVVIGRAIEFASELHTDSFDELVTYFGRYSGDPDVTEAHRALIATREVRKRLTERGRTGGVGGLYQVITLSPRAIRPVPYFYLADVEPGFRTYVAMRIEDGEWIQEHRPTGTKVRVRSPFAIDPTQPPRMSSVFESSERFSRSSPGVVPAKPLETVFSLYSPPNVPTAVRPSWGDEPLAPLTYGPEWSE